jgi:sugar lactone lactonase YvrE
MRKLILIPAVFLVLACQDRTPVQPDLEVVPEMAVGKPPVTVMRVIAKGSAIHGADGIIVGPDGNLYITSAFGQEIVVMNPRNGRILHRLGTELGVEFPDDLVFGPDGSLYWTEIFMGNVSRMTPEGVVTKQLVAPGVNPITFSPDGRLFVGLCFYGDGLYELDSELVAPPRPIIAATPENPYPLGFVNGFDFGPDGRLYGPLFAAGMVVSVDVGQPGDPPSPSPWTDGTIRVVATGFTEPTAVKFDPWDQLHLVDAGTGEVVRVDRTSGEKTVMAILAEGISNLAFDRLGELYVSNFQDGSITRMLSSGQGRSLSTGGMVFPGGVAVLQRPDGRDAVFVADLWSLREFDGRTGGEVGAYKGPFLPSGDTPPLAKPLTVSADGDHLIVSSVLDGAVQVWDPQTDQVLEHYLMPVPLNAIGFQDDLVVASLGLGGVVRVSDHAMILPINGVNVFLPAGLATDGEVLWVADWATGIVWRIGFDGKTPLAPVPVAFDLANPEGLALDVDGSLLVVEAGARRLSRVDLTTGEKSVVVEGLELGVEASPGFPPTWSFNGVAVGPSGAIYITGDVTNVLYRIWPR